MLEDKGLKSGKTLQYDRVHGLSFIQVNELNDMPRKTTSFLEVLLQLLPFITLKDSVFLCFIHISVFLWGTVIFVSWKWKNCSLFPCSICRYLSPNQFRSFNFWRNAYLYQIVDSNSVLPVGWIHTPTVKPNACFQILICGAAANTEILWFNDWKNYWTILCRITLSIYWLTSKDCDFNL